MNGSENTFCPKMQGQTGLKEKGLCKFKNMFMFVFYNPILLRGIDARLLISCAFLFK